MAYQLWAQDNFTKGELSPYMYARATIAQYYNGLKTAQNVLTYPSGAAGKRFGTLYQSTIPGLTAFDQLFFQTFQYLDQCTYQVVFTPNNILILLEGLAVANVATTLDAQSVYNLSYTVIGPVFRVAGALFKPYDLTRSAYADELITAVNGNVITITNPVLLPDSVFPSTFKHTGAGAFPSTTPQIKEGVVYFIKNLTSTTGTVHLTAKDAKFGLNPIVFNNAGSGTNYAVIQNAWSFAHTNFKNLPVYDFNGATTSYDNIVFTPTAKLGNAVVVNLSAPYAPLDASYVGGAFIGNGGTSRIISVASTSQFTVAVQTPFDDVTGIQGSLAFLAEPAWSDARGWPQICGSYQNRALFANTASLPNGFYASVVNAYNDFGDLTTDDDDAISWYPSSNDVNVIRFIVPFRSITVHTNSGIYSSPLSEIAAITPNTFTLQLQDSTPADVLQPEAIDNQIIVLSGNDVHTMLWDGINNAYTSNIVSVVNEQTIRDPVDETAFADLRRAGSRYVFITNANGSLAVYQTLLSENVSGFTPQITEQSYGTAQFLQTASSTDGRCWFIIQRQIATASAANAIIDGGNAVIKATNPTGFSTTEPTAITFTTGTGLPPTTPQIDTNTYYWAIAVNAIDFTVYSSQDDAIAGANPILFPNSVVPYTFNVIAWPLSTIFTLEELTQDVHLDCAVYYNGTPTDTLTTGNLFNAQNIKMVGDGFGFDAVGFNNQVVFKAHGSNVNVSEAYAGFPINTIMEPMPLAPPPGQITSLTKPNHVRTVRFMFNNTIGGTINGVPIALNQFNQAHIGDPPFPSRGVFEMSIMKGWDDFNNPTFTIEHNEPFNIELTGVFYSVDIT